MNNGIYIEKIDITAFGKLRNLSLSPSDGMNIITAPNESGKSTLAMFIKFIFYGFGGNRKQTLNENEKQLYLPWDGSRAAGGITLVTPDGKFRIERSQTASKETLEVYDAYTRKSVFNGMIPGEVFFGISEESFGKVLFFRRLYQQKNGDDSLAEQIQNLIFSADEKTNTDRAMKKLRELKSSLKNSQKHGIIPDLESDLNSYEEKLTASLEIKRELDTVQVSLNEKKRKIAYNDEKLSALNKEMENIRKYEAKKRLTSLLSLAKRKKAADDNYSECMSSFAGDNVPDTAFVKQLIDDNAEYSLLEKKIEELENNIKDEKKRLEMLKTSNPLFTVSPDKVKGVIKKRTLLSFIMFALTALFGALCFLMFTMNKNALFACFAAAGGIAAIVAIYASVTTPNEVKKLGFSERSKLIEAINGFPKEMYKAEEKESKISAMKKSLTESTERYNSLKDSIEKRISKYVSANEGEEFNAVLQRMLKLSMEAGALKAESISLSDRLNESLENVNIDELRAYAEGAVEPSRDENTVLREIEFYTSANQGMKKQETELEKMKSSLEARSPSPSLIYGKRESVKKKLDDCRMKYEALSTALDVLTEAGDYMKATISPKLASLATERFAPATGEKYREMSLTTDLTMSVQTEFGEKSADYLSGGAKDMAYLCLRYALVELLYERKKPFIVLDDAFSRIDDTRLVLLLKQLSSISESSQTFIFTCHERESIILNGLKKEVTELELN